LEEMTSAITSRAETVSLAGTTASGLVMVILEVPGVWRPVRFALF
jgi:hypothetical protein